MLGTWRTVVINGQLEKGRFVLAGFFFFCGGVLQSYNEKGTLRCENSRKSNFWHLWHCLTLPTWSNEGSLRNIWCFSLLGLILINNILLILLDLSLDGLRPQPLQVHLLLLWSQLMESQALLEYQENHHLQPWLIMQVVQQDVVLRQAGMHIFGYDIAILGLRGKVLVAE